MSNFLNISKKIILKLLKIFYSNKELIHKMLKKIPRIKKKNHKNLVYLLMI